MAQPAFDPLRDAPDESEAVSHRLVASAQDAASRTGASVRRAGKYVQSRMGELAERAQHLAHGANGQVEHLTGRPIQAWPGDARKAVRAHPFQAIGATIGLGYVLGKIMTRPRAAKTRTR